MFYMMISGHRKDKFVTHTHITYSVEVEIYGKILLKSVHVWMRFLSLLEILMHLFIVCMSRSNKQYAKHSHVILFLVNLKFMISSLSYE